MCECNVVWNENGPVHVHGYLALIDDRGSLILVSVHRPDRFGPTHSFDADALRAGCKLICPDVIDDGLELCPQFCTRLDDDHFVVGVMSSIIANPTDAKNAGSGSILSIAPVLAVIDRRSMKFVAHTQTASVCCVCFVVSHVLCIVNGC